LPVGKPWNQFVHESLEGSEAIPVSQQHALRNRRVLVVEDDPLIACDLQAILENEGILVIGPVGRLADAMALVERSLPDAAVLDVRLETDTSLPLAAWLAERRVPFLFQTGDSTLIAAAGLAAPVLRKPLRPALLIAALTALLVQQQ
jgi:DNA-binding response OmpR family regulator